MDPNQRNHDESANTGLSQPDDPAAVAADVLLGAKSIAEHITALGFPVNESDIYYLHRARKWPFSKYGAFLAASKHELTRHAQRITRGPAAA